MKKKVLIITLVVGILIIFIWGLWGSRPVSKTRDVVSFKVQSGKNKMEIVSDLKKAGIINSKIVTLAYVFFSSDINLQAGTYQIDKSNSPFAIIKQIDAGDTKSKAKTVKITFVEGKTFRDYAKQISQNFDITYDEVINKCADTEFLKTLISKYEFLSSDILNESIYYPLEGYLYPDTYEFYENSSIEDIIYKMLDNFLIKYNELKNEFTSSNYSIHDIITMSSIIEKEAVYQDDRKKVSQVIYKRLGINMSLGMDVTTYYAVFKDMQEELTSKDLASSNGYNTRNEAFIGLPVGPICNPSLESIKAALNPSDTNYIYFIADVNTGKIYFFEDYEDFLDKKKMLG